MYNIKLRKRSFAVFEGATFPIRNCPSMEAERYLPQCFTKTMFKRHQQLLLQTLCFLSFARMLSVDSDKLSLQTQASDLQLYFIWTPRQVQLKAGGGCCRRLHALWLHAGFCHSYHCCLSSSFGDREPDRGNDSSVFFAVPGSWRPLLRYLSILVAWSQDTGTTCCKSGRRVTYQYRQPAGA